MRRLALAVALVTVTGLVPATAAHAAQGCGFGWHRNADGNCVVNQIGPGAKPVPGRPGCWRNVSGQLRCFRA